MPHAQGASALSCGGQQGSHVCHEPIASPGGMQSIRLAKESQQSGWLTFFVQAWCKSFQHSGLTLCRVFAESGTRRGICCADCDAAAAGPADACIHWRASCSGWRPAAAAAPRAPVTLLMLDILAGLLPRKLQLMASAASPGTSCHGTSFAAHSRCSIPLLVSTCSSAVAGCCRGRAAAAGL